MVSSNISNSNSSAFNIGSSRHLASKTFSEELKEAYEKRKTKLGIPKCPGKYQLDVCYRYNDRNFEEKNECHYEVDISRKLHHITPIITTYAIRKECERERRRRIKEEKSGTQLFCPVRKKLLNEFKQRIALSKVNLAKERKRHQQMREEQLDLIHRDLMWKQKKPQIIKDIEDAREFALRMMDWRNLDPKLQEELANLHQMKTRLNNQITTIGNLLKEEVHEEQELSRQRSEEMKDRVLSQLRAREMRKRISDIENDEAEWREMLQRETSYNHIRRQNTKLRLAVNTELKDLFRRVKEKVKLTESLHKEHHRNKMSYVLSELQRERKGNNKHQSQRLENRVEHQQQRDVVNPVEGLIEIYKERNRRTGS